MSNSMTDAIRQLNSLRAGTCLAVGADHGSLILTAPGMAPISLTLPVGAELVVDDHLAEILGDVTESLAAAQAAAEEIEPNQWYWLAASLLAAGQRGIEVASS